jgi:pentatricopeptide repeat protein
MVNEGLTPNDITFASILSACSHSGLIDDAQSFFGLMTKRYGIAPSLQHQTCMVMGFGCGGYFEEALSVIRAMPCSDHSSVWLTLLGACGKWGNVEIGKIIFGKAMKLDNCFGAFNALVDRMSTDFGLREVCVKDKA